MATTIKIKRGLKLNLPTLNEGELAHCTDTNELFIGTAQGNVRVNDDLDDVLEFQDFASFPAEGDSGKIYVDASEDKVYRWSGSTYVNISSPDIATPTEVIEGTSNEKVMTPARTTQAINIHRDVEYPHRFTDPSTNIEYEWGLGVENGELGIIYREVTE